MTPQRWQRIEAVFHSVLSAPPSERLALLDRQCGDDHDLRREVDLLLQAESESGSFLASRNLPRAETSLVPEPSLVGHTIGPYEALSTLGTGAMGEVYLARDTRLGRQVALKILPARFSCDPGRVDRFLREARAASALNHPNIVTLLDIGEERGMRYIVTEFIPGGTLRQRLAAGRLEVPQALEIGIQCAAALETAHAAGISHRDIKPDNVMLRPDGLVKIVDFGLARSSTELRAPGAMETEAGTLLGTPRYMSPEQARGERSDALSDVFSLGAVIYEMLAGVPAFPGATTADVLAALLQADPPPVLRMRPECPAGIDPILARALAKDRAHRYQTMREFATDLRQFAQTLRLREAEAGMQGGHRTSPWIAYVVAAAVLAGVGAAGWIWKTSATGAPSEVAYSARPLTSFPGFKDFPVLSNDGRRIAFSWNGGQGGLGGKLERDIYVKPVGPGEPVAVTHSSDDNLWPAWSPDGRRLVYGRRRSDATSDYYINSAEGGQERKIVTAGGGVSWSPDGRKLALVRNSVESGGVFTLDLQTSEQRDLTSPKPAYDSLPQYSPDGRWIAFTRGVVDQARGIWIVPAEGGTAQAVLPAENSINGLTWTADSRAIVYSTQSEGGGNHIWSVPIAGGVPRRLELGSDGVTNPNIPAAGGWMTFTWSSIDTNIYRSTGAGLNAAHPFGKEEPFQLSSREDDSPAFSPDGSRVVFVSTRSGEPELWVTHLGSGHTVQLTSFRNPAIGSPRWSPDGRWIAFDRHTSKTTEVYVVAASGGEPRRVTFGAAGAYMPAWSADGKWLYFSSSRSGDSELWRVPAAGGTETQVTQGGAREAWCSPDGQRIYFTRTRPASGIWTVPVEGGPELPVPELEPYVRVGRAWGVIPSGIYFLSRQDGPRQVLRFLSFESRKVRELVTLEKEPVWNVPAIALSPNGRDLLTVHLDHQINDLMLVDRFR